MGVCSSIIVSRLPSLSLSDSEGKGKGLFEVNSDYDSDSEDKKLFMVRGTITTVMAAASLGN